MFYNSRWYDPYLSRFAQADSLIPLQTQGTQAWDRYAYVNNNPLRYTDPSGHFVLGGVGEFILLSTVVGAAAGGMGYMINGIRSGETFDGGKLAVAMAGGALAGAAISVGVVASAPLLLAAGVGAAFGGGSYMAWNSINKNEFDPIDFSGAVIGGAVTAVALPAMGLPVNFFTAGLVGATVNLEQYMAVELAHTLIEGDDFVLQNDEGLWAYGSGLFSGVIDSFPINKGQLPIAKSVSSGLIANAPTPDLSGLYNHEMR